MWDEEDLQQLFQQYLTGGGYGGLIGGEAAAAPPPLRNSAFDRIASHPAVQFGMGVFANNQGNYGQLGPALGGGLNTMMKTREVQARTDLQRAQMLAKYQQQQARENAISQLDLPEDQKQMLRADPAAARQMMSKYFGWDADSPAAHAQKLARAKASGTYVGGTTVMLPKEEETLGKEVPGRFLDEFKVSRDKVGGALNNWGVWQRIEKAANEGAFTGPAGDKMLTFAQIGDWLGMTGKDTQETMANTRKVIQGLAELSLNNRELLKGTGPITDFEQRIASKAASGEVNELSPTEVITLARLGRRAALAQAAEHNRRIEDFASRDQRYAEIARHYKQDIPRHMWPTPTDKARASLKAARNSPGYVEAFRKQFGPWTDEILAEQ
jgi:hypothetical protein